VSDAVTVLRDGRHVLSLDRPRPDHMDEILAAMLNQRAGTAPQHRPNPLRQPPEPRPGLATTGLRGPLGLRVDSLHARRGEVVGMSGLAGAGVEKLFAILFGGVTPLSGAVELPSGQAFRGGAAAMVQAGVAFAPADRKRLGLSLDQSLADDGRVVLLYASDPAEFAAVAGRVLVFVDGRVQCELHAGALTEHGIVAAMNAPAAPPIHQGQEP